ncbi:MAG: TIR domain-containing protein [Anaerolineales bacterium]|nr:TIR domain-containing protein [Anaerolineales bacterium]
MAEKIVDALAQNDLDTWIDWKSIPKGEDWEQEIYRGIEEADAFLFLISPDSAKSEMCNKEIAHAVKNNKRILPIVIHDTDVKTFLYELAKKEISKRNWVFCRKEQDNFEKAIEGTQTTIHTNYAWLKFHTNLQVKALNWERRKDSSRLLRGRELSEAEKELTKDSTQDPQPTELQRQFVLDSRRRETRTRNSGLTIAVGVIVALFLLILFAFNQRNIAFDNAATARANANMASTAQGEANAQKLEAQNQSQIALARQLAAQSEQIINSDIDLGILLAIQANKVADLPETRFALINAIEYEPTKDKIINLEGIDSNRIVYQTMQISPDGQSLIATLIYSDGTNPDFGCSKTDIFIIDTLSGNITSQTTIDFYATIHDINPAGDIVGLEIKECGKEDEYVGLWSVSNRTITKRINHFAYDLIFLNDGKTLVTAGKDANIVFWDINTGQSIRTFEGNDDSVSTLTTDLDEKILLSGSYNGKILVWDIETGNTIGEPIFVRGKDETSYDAINSIVITPENRYIIATALAQRVSHIGRLIIWDMQSNSMVKAEEAGAVLIDLHSQEVVGSYELSSNAIKLWNVVTGETVQEIRGYSAGLAINGDALMVSQDGKWLYGLELNRVILWNLEKLSQTGFPLLKMDTIPLVAVKEDGKLLAIGGNDKIAIYNLETGKINKVIKTNPNQTVADLLAFQPGHPILAELENSIMKFWDVESNLLIDLLGTNINTEEFVFSSDGSLLAFVKDDKQTVNIVDINTKNIKVFQLEEKADYFFKMGFTFGNKYLVMGGNSTNIYVWDLQNEKLKKIPVAAVNVWTYPIINPSENTVAVTNLTSNRIDVYDIENESITKSFIMSNSEYLAQPVFSSDGKKLAVAVCKGVQQTSICTNSYAYIFDVDSAKIEAIIPLRAVNLNFSNDGNIIFAAGNDNVLYGWNYDNDLWQNLGCQLISRNFTSEEWNTFIGTILPYNDTCNVNDFSNNDYTNNLPPILLNAPSDVQNISELKVSGNISEAGGWSTSSTLPNGLSESFSAIVQCRKSADSDTITNEFLALWAITLSNSQVWVEDGKGTILIKNDSGEIVRQYENLKSSLGGFNDWVMSANTLKGYVMDNPFGGNTTIELEITEISTKKLIPQAGDNNYTVSYVGHVVSGNPKYPRHTIHLEIKNNNENYVMDSVLIVGVITNDKGQVVDILEQEDNEQVQIISPQQEKDFALSSISKTGRCVGAAGSGYTLRYWISYFREDNQLMTKHFEIAIE